ncbi:MAG: hypothetical protein AAGC44_09210 [Planctomycetota bacterium]
MSNTCQTISVALRELEQQQSSDPLATIRFPVGVVTSTNQWCKLLGNSISKNEDAKRLADTLTGCETLAWFIDRFETYGAGRSVPAKLLLHQLMDVIHELCVLKNGGRKQKFVGSVKKALNDNNLQEQLIRLWQDPRNRSHCSEARDARDHGYDYFQPISEAWNCLAQVVTEFGGDISNYNGLLSTLSSRERERESELRNRPSGL